MNIIKIEFLIIHWIIVLILGLRKKCIQYNKNLIFNEIK